MKLCNLTLEQRGLPKVKEEDSWWIYWFYLAI